MVYLPIHYLGKLKLLVRCNIDGCIRLKGKISSYLLLVYLNYVLILIRCIYMYLCKLKCYVQNKAHPEGSIAEGYQADEAYGIYMGSKQYLISLREMMIDVHQHVISLYYSYSP